MSRNSTAARSTRRPVWLNGPESMAFPRIVSTSGPVPFALLAALAVGVLPAIRAAAQPPPAAPKTLAGEDTRRVEELNKTIDQVRRAGRFAEAVAPAQQVLAICEKALGPDHWQTSDAHRTVEDLRKIAALPEEGHRAMASVGDVQGRILTAHSKGHYAEAEELSRTLLSIRRKWLGENHPDSATSLNDTALLL